MSPDGTLTQSLIEKAAHEIVLKTQAHAKLGVDGLLCLLAAPIGYAVLLVGAALSSQYARRKKVGDDGPDYDGLGFMVYAYILCPTALMVAVVMGCVLLVMLHTRPPLTHRGSLLANCVLVPALVPLLAPMVLAFLI